MHPAQSPPTPTLERVLVRAVVANVDGKHAAGRGQPQRAQQVQQRVALVPVNLGKGREKVERRRLIREDYSCFSFSRNSKVERK